MHYLHALKIAVIAGGLSLLGMGFITLYMIALSILTEFLEDFGIDEDITMCFGVVAVAIVIITFIISLLS